MTWSRSWTRTFARCPVLRIGLLPACPWAPQSPNVAVKRLDVFASIGVLSAGTFRPATSSPGGTAVFDRINPNFLGDPAATNKKVRLLFFSCGTEDPRLASLNDLQKQLQSRNINLVAKTYTGEHEWKVWRHSLADMAPLLFR